MTIPVESKGTISEPKPIIHFGFRKLDIESAKSIESPWHHCYTLDLSAGGGALISTDLEDLAPGDHIEFELIIPGGPVFGIAKIVRTIEEERERQLGLMFVSMAAKDKDRNSTSSSKRRIGET